METWVLIIMLNTGREKIPAPIPGYATVSECQKAGGAFVDGLNWSSFKCIPGPRR